MYASAGCGAKEVGTFGGWGEGWHLMECGPVSLWLQPAGMNASGFLHTDDLTAPDIAQPYLSDLADGSPKPVSLDLQA